MHLGDVSHLMHFLRKFVALNNVDVELCFSEKYNKEITLQNDSPRIHLVNQSSSAAHNFTDLWKKYKELGYPNVPKTDPNIFKAYNEMYVYFFQFVCQKLGYNCPINKPEDMLFDNPGILTPTPLSQEWDYLLINSFPLSGQVNGTEQEMDAIFDEKIAKLRALGKSIVTTKKITGIPCTRDHDLSLLGIANISINAKNIVGINTAPYLMCFNIWNIDKVQRWVHYNDRHLYRYNNRITNVFTKEEFAAVNLALQ